jgi:hypothetical protein
VTSWLDCLLCSPSEDLQEMVEISVASCCLDILVITCPEEAGSGWKAKLRTRLGVKRRLHEIWRHRITRLQNERLGDISSGNRDEVRLTQEAIRANKWMMASRTGIHDPEDCQAVPLSHFCYKSKVPMSRQKPVIQQKSCYCSWDNAAKTHASKDDQSPVTYGLLRPLCFSETGCTRSKVPASRAASESLDGDVIIG